MGRARAAEWLPPRARSRYAPGERGNGRREEGLEVRRLSPVDAAWLAIESRDTPMHVGGLFEFTLPDDAPDDYLRTLFSRMRAERAVPPPWNLQLVQAPLVGSRVPLMREIHDVDLDYH